MLVFKTVGVPCLSTTHSPTHAQSGGWCFFLKRMMTNSAKCDKYESFWGDFGGLVPDTVVTVVIAVAGGARSLCRAV